MKRIAFIISTVGYHWEEVFAPYQVYQAAGFDMNFYTVDGSPPVADPNSVLERPLLSLVGLGVSEDASPHSPEGKTLLALFNTKLKPLSALNNDYDALYIPGGHGCLFDVNTNNLVHEKILAAFQQKKIISAVCHGSSALAFVVENGKSIIHNKKIIGFLDSQDSLLEKLGLIDKKFLPLPFRNEEKIHAAGANFSPADRLLAFTNPSYFQVDLPFVTGVGPKSAKPVAKAVVNILETKS